MNAIVTPPTSTKPAAGLLPSTETGEAAALRRQIAALVQQYADEHETDRKPQK